MDWGSYQQEYVHYYNTPDTVSPQFTYEYTGAVILIASKKHGYTIYFKVRGHDFLNP